MIKNRAQTILRRTQDERRIQMGRDDSIGKGTGKQSLPQTPKNLKIAPNKMKEEIAKELDELHQLGGKPLNRAAKNNK